MAIGGGRDVRLRDRYGDVAAEILWLLHDDGPRGCRAHAGPSYSLFGAVPARVPDAMPSFVAQFNRRTGLLLVIDGMTHTLEDKGWRAIDHSLPGRRVGCI